MKDNRIALGGITKDRDLTDVDLTLKHAYYNRAADVANQDYKYTASHTSGIAGTITFDGFGYSASEERFIKIYLRGLTTTGADSDNWTLFGSTEEYVLTSDYYQASQNNNVDFFVDKINANTLNDITA